MSSMTSRLFIAALLAGPVVASGSTIDAEQAEIEALGHTWIEAFRSGDLETLMSLYEPDAIVALHGKPALRGLSEVREYMTSAAGRGDIEFVVDLERIEVNGDLAYLVSGYWFSVTPEDSDEAIRDSGRSVLIFRRGSDDRWRIAVDIDQATPDVVFPAP